MWLYWAGLMYPFNFHTLVHAVMLNANKHKWNLRPLILSYASKITQKSVLAKVNEDFINFWGSVFIYLSLSRLRNALLNVYIPPPKIFIYAPVISLTFSLEG